MAKDDEKKATAADKGKGKAPAANDAETTKDAKPDLEDKKGGVATSGGMLCPRRSWCSRPKAIVLTINCRGAQ